MQVYGDQDGDDYVTSSAAKMNSAGKYSVSSVIVSDFCHFRELAAPLNTVIAHRHSRRTFAAVFVCGQQHHSGPFSVRHRTAPIVIIIIITIITVIITIIIINISTSSCCSGVAWRRRRRRVVRPTASVSVLESYYRARARCGGSTRHTHDIIILLL